MFSIKQKILGPKYTCKKFKHPQIVLVSNIHEKNGNTDQFFPVCPDLLTGYANQSSQYLTVYFNT